MLVALMRRLPVLPLPEPTGSRQPIHASQLAGVALCSALALSETPRPQSTRHVQFLGGDEVLSYRTMLLRPLSRYANTLTFREFERGYDVTVGYLLAHEEVRSAAAEWSSLTHGATPAH